MGEWTWLFTRFPIADVELTSEPVDAVTANVLVRTIRQLPGSSDEYEVRVAPHNVAPFRGGPWLQRFTAEQLSNPGTELTVFRQYIWDEVQAAKRRTPNF